APVLGAAGEAEGLVWATGHHRNGILLAPVTADIVAGVLDGIAEPPAFAPGRFARSHAGAAA
ncbi:MAG: glycine oxidase, partial [Solirubrobacteraceae bacterium]|nr:glycine oxidase [Solirubrobacteraceae bacterium]